MPDFGYVWSFTIGDYEKIEPGKVGAPVYNSPTYRAVHKYSSKAFQAQIYRTKRFHTEIYYTLRFYCPAKHNTKYTISFSLKMTIDDEDPVKCEVREWLLNSTFPVVKKLDGWYLDFRCPEVKKLDEWCRTKIGQQLTIAIQFTLEDDLFDVFRLFNDNPLRPTAPITFDEKHPSSARLLLFYNSNTGSDFTISADDGDFPVHSNVLAVCSSYFVTLFAEHNTNLDENDKARLRIPDCKKSVLQVMIKYFYLAYLDLPDSTTIEDFNVLLSLTKQFLLKKEVLNALELELIKIVLERAKNGTYWNTLSECLDLAVLHELKILEDVTMSTMLESIEKEDDNQLSQDNRNRLFVFAVERARCPRHIDIS